MDLALLQLNAGFLQELQDVVRGHGTEQLALGTGANLQGDRRGLELGSQLLAFLAGGLALRFRILLALLDLAARHRRDHRGQIAGEQEIAGVTIGHAHHVARMPQTVHIFHQDNFF